MRTTCLNMIHELAKMDERVIFIGSDLRSGLLDGMRKDFPRRWLMEGVSEQHIVGMAAGLAKEGFIPYINTIASFWVRRAYEQIAVDLCLPDLPVRVIGNGGGYVYAPLGPTHQAIEDIALMCLLPNMTVVAPADADEMQAMMRETLDWPHPIYIRLAKGGDPIVTARAPFVFGRAVPLREHMPNMGEPTVLLVVTGNTGARALDAADMIEAERHIPCDVLHFPTLKPFDLTMLVSYAVQAKVIVTIEEHVLIGGLGSAVNDALIRCWSGSLPRVLHLGIDDSFAHDYGTQASLMHSAGLDPEQIARSVCEVLL